MKQTAETNFPVILVYRKIKLKFSVNIRVFMQSWFIVQIDKIIELAASSKNQMKESSLMQHYDARSSDECSLVYKPECEVDS